MRHAKSSWEDNDKKDYDCPLNKRGKSDAPEMGRYLKEIGMLPDRIISSPAQRAKETVQLLAEAAGIANTKIQWNEDLYFNGANAYLESVRKVTDSYNTVLIAGHNPSVEQVIGFLGGGDAASKVTTANIACFELSVEHWSDVENSNCSFKWLMRPKDLG